MQPGPPPDPSASQRPPAAGWPPTAAQRPPGPDYAGAPGGAPVAADGTPERRSRPGLVALVAVLVEIVVIAAAANQAVAKRVSESIFADSRTASYDWGRALLTYQWRFSPLPTDQFRAAYSQLALIGVTLIGTAVLVLLAARGGAGFWRVFALAWAAVIASTGLGAVVRGLVIDRTFVAEGNMNPVRFALFDTFGPSQAVFVASFVLGFVVALAAGLTAMLTGRPAKQSPPPAYAPPPAQVPQQQAVGAMPPPPPADATREFRRPDDVTATQQFRPPVEQPSGPPVERPSEAAGERPSGPAGADDATQQYPAVPGSSPRETTPHQDVRDDPDTRTR